MKRSPLRKVSNKRSRELAVYRGLRKDFLTVASFCEAKTLDCTLRSVDVHHIAGRNGERLNDQTQWLAICRPCHRWIHDNPAEAREKGLLK